MELNLTKLYKDWYKFCRQEGANRDLGDDDVNLNTLKLKATQCQWSVVNNDTRPITREVTLQTDQPATGAFGQVHTTRECENLMTVVIESGVLKGINRTLKITLDNRTPGLVQNFGNKLEIIPSKIRSEVKDIKMKLQVAMEQPISHRSDKVTVECTAHEYRARFTCKVEIKGSVTTRYGDDSPISTILDQLRRINQQPADFADVEISGNKLIIPMTGEVELRWESDHKYRWQ